MVNKPNCVGEQQVMAFLRIWAGELCLCRSAHSDSHHLSPPIDVAAHWSHEFHD